MKLEPTKYHCRALEVLLTVKFIPPRTSYDCRQLPIFTTLLLSFAVSVQSSLLAKLKESHQLKIEISAKSLKVHQKIITTKMSHEPPTKTFFILSESFFNVEIWNLRRRSFRRNFWLIKTKDSEKRRWLRRLFADGTIGAAPWKPICSIELL